MSHQVRLRLLPSTRCLFDEPVQLKVSGLRSRQVVTMRARSTDEKGVVFSSSAAYRADGNGEIDLSRDPSLNGTYVGVEPMGLLWSMKADTLHKRFRKDTSLSPHVVNFSVHEEERLLAEATNERFLLREGVSRAPVTQGDIRGVLFTPQGSGPFPAVLDLYTFGGGLTEKRAALLASRGFLVLTASLYGYKDQPKNVNEIHLDYFEEAVNFLKNQDKVGSKGVGIISISKSGDLALSAASYLWRQLTKIRAILPQHLFKMVGSKGVGIISISKSGDLALSAASYLPGVEAVVWINGCSANVALPLHYKKRQIHPALMFDNKKIIYSKSGAIITKFCMHNPLEEENRATLIPIEKAKSRFLFVASEDDLNWDSKAYMEQMVERLKHHGKNNFESVSYPGAGHYLEPPYGPYCPSSFHQAAGKPVLWGGEPRSHAAAEVHMWKKIQEFFRTHLSCNDVQNKSKL